MNINTKRLIVILPFIKELAQKFQRDEKEITANGLTAYDFKGEVLLTYEDGSSIHYKNAFMLSNQEEIAVFTEHCGYHLYDIKEFESYKNLEV